MFLKRASVPPFFQGRPAELKAAGAAAVAGIAAERETDGVVAWPWRIVSGSSTNR